MNVETDAVAVLVEGDLLHRRHREALGEAAHDLPLDDHRVDPDAAVVDRDDRERLPLARAAVDLDDHRVRPERVGHVRRVVVVRPSSPASIPSGWFVYAAKATSWPSSSTGRRALHRELAAVATRRPSSSVSSRCAAIFCALARTLRATTAVAAPATGVIREA